MKPAAAQPYGIEHTTVDGVFIKQMAIPKAGTLVPQHSHSYDHVSMLAKGSVRVYANGFEIGVRHAPYPIEIAAHVKHAFLSLEDDTIIYCIHNVGRTGNVDVQDEHLLTFDPPCAACDARDVCKGVQ